MININSLIAGIDGGGTKTDFVLCSSDGTILKRIILGPSNPNDVGFDASCDLLKNGLTCLLEKFCGLQTQLSGFFAGLSGGTTGGYLGKYKEFFKACLPNSNTANGSDAVNALSCGLKTGDGCAIIAGTGSIAYVRKDLKIHRIGGWGYLFDNSGSGYDLGRDAINYALRYYDGRGEGTLLTQMLERRLGKNVPESLDDIYRLGKKFIASFAPLVFEAYELNDNAARDIIIKAAAYIAELISSSRTFLDKNDNNVVLIGGLFSKKEILLPLIKENLKVDCNFIFPEVPPVFGAVVEAGVIARLTIDDNFENNFRFSLIK